MVAKALYWCHEDRLAMQWPWVSRALNDFVVSQLLEEREENARLLEHLVALKVQGAAVPEPIPTLQRAPLDPVQAAITAKAGSDRQLRTLMGREAAKARAMGMSDAEIIQQIEVGVVNEDGPLE